MSSSAIDPQQATQDSELQHVVAVEVRRGLGQTPRSLTAWLFYDERGSQLFEQITALPEYYLTRTERGLFFEHAAEIVEAAADGQTLTLIELGAGTASKSGILLAAAATRQGEVLYQPIDVSESALAEAGASLEAQMPRVRVVSQVADYTAAPLIFTRPAGARVLALYIGSSIGNFYPDDAVEVLRNLRASLQPGDSLLLGADLAPAANKSVSSLLAAYDDAAGVTAEFNRNVLNRLNRELGTNFDLNYFQHRARWNQQESRIEMHLEAASDQVVIVPANSAGEAMSLRFRRGETIHTENSYKFTEAAVSRLLTAAGFKAERVWKDAKELFSVTLAKAR